MSSEFGKQFDRAQKAYEAQEPPEDHNCEKDGHQWKQRRVAYINGEYVVEMKCKICGKLDLV